MTRTAMSLLLLLCASRTVCAQDAGLYVGGSGAMAPWAAKAVSEGSPSSAFSNASAESNVLDLVGEAGWSFNRATSFGIEIGLQPRRNTVVQRHFYLFNTFIRESRYREHTVFFVLRHRAYAGSRVDVSLIGGAGTVHGSSIARGARGRRNSSGSVIFDLLGEPGEQAHSTVGISGGADLSIPVTRSLAVVPQFRMLMVARGDTQSRGFGNLGLPGVVYRFGVGARARF